MTEKEIAKSPEKTPRSDHSDRASHQTAQEAVVGDDKNQSLHHKSKLSDNQHNLSDPALLSPKEGESIEDYRKRVEAIQKNRFEITGLEDGTNSPQDQNDNMTTAEVKALGGKDAEMMFDAINKMPEGQEKDQAKEAIKASYTEVLSDTPQTDPYESKLLLEGHISNTPESDTTEKIGWLDAAQKISQLPLDKQLQVIGAGLSAGTKELNHQQRERAIGALIGTVQGVGEIATNLGRIADFSAYCILGDDRAATMGAEFGESLGKSIVGGLKLFDGAHKYLNAVGAAGAEGNYSKVFRDLSTLGDNLNRAWSDLPPREQSRILAKLTTDMAADGLMGLGAARNLGKATKFTEILDTIAEDAQKLHKAGKSLSSKTINKLQEAIDPVVEKLRDRIGPKWAHATEYGGDISTGLHEAEEIGKGAFILEKRIYKSKFDPSHRLTPIEAARENARIKREPLDEDAWKKLTPKQKAEKLESDKYKLVENPDIPEKPIDSRELSKAHRGDQYLYSEYDSEGFKKAHIGKNGDLVPASIEGKTKGRDVLIKEHLLQSRNRFAKQDSPFISVGTNGVVMKYGDGQGVTIDMKGLRKAVARGEVKGVEIVEHDELIDYINTTKDLSNFERRMARRFANKDNEFLIKGIIPARFLKIRGY